MDFAEIKAVWDAQESRTVFAVDVDELQRTVQRRSRSLRWGVSFEEFAFMFVCIFGPGINGWYSGEHGYETIGAVIYTGVALFMLRARIVRMRHEKTFDDTIVGELDRSIYRLSCQIWRAKNVVRWFLFPTAIYIVISNTQQFRPEGVLAALIGYPLCYFAMRFAWKKNYEKQKHSLEALRAELTANGKGNA